MSGSIERARTGWGETLPDWIEALAKACDATSQNKVAKRMGRSGSLVSLVLANRYSGDMDGLRQQVEGIWLNGKVDCPVWGELSTDKCRAWRIASDEYRSGTSFLQMARACNACPIKAEAAVKTPRTDEVAS